MDVDFYTNASLSIIDDTSKQVTALQILIECMSGRKSVAPCIYEEHEVLPFNKLYCNNYAHIVGVHI